MWTKPPTRIETLNTEKQEPITQNETQIMEKAKYLTPQH